MSFPRWVVFAAAGLLGSAAAAQDSTVPLPAQPTAVRFLTGSIPDTVTVGDRFRALVRVAAPPGFRVEFPRNVASSPAVQALDSVHLAASASGEHTAMYPMVAWRTGSLSLPPLQVRVTSPAGATQQFRVALRLPFVRSVLPPGDTTVRPRPAKGIIVAERNLLPLALVLALVLAALLLGAAAYLIWRWRIRFPDAPTTAPMPTSPREAALAALARAAPLIEGDRVAFFHAVADVLRDYLAVLSSRWGPDLATAELLDELGSAGLDPVRLTKLATILRAADLVKFARYTPTEQEAVRTLAAARDWVQRFEPSGNPESVPVRKAS